MATTIAVYDSASTLYFLVGSANSQYWNGATFEVYTAAHYADYVISMYEDGGSGIYRGTFPAVAEGTYDVIVKRRSGESPAEADEIIAADAFASDGTSLRVSADVGAISHDPAAADLLEAMMDGTGSGVVDDESATATSFVTDLSEETTDHHSGAYILFTSGALRRQSRRISAYNGTTKAITMESALTDAPADGDRFVILGRGQA